MKNIILLFLFVIIFPTTVNAQADTLVLVSPDGELIAPVDSVDSLSQECSLPLVYNEPFDYKNTRYWQHNRVKKFAAGSCLGVGGLSLFVYAIIRMWAFDAGDDKDFHPLDILWGGGSAAMMSASIPLYISARKDRKKARAMTSDEYYQSQQHRNYRRTGIRFELSGCMTYPTDDGGMNKKLGYGIGFEGRSYVGNSNFDLALKFSWDKNFYYESYNDGYYRDEDHGGLRMTFLADYNFCKEQVLNPYVGAGLGFSPVSMFYVEPRVGIELFDHHRLSVFSHIAFSHDEYDYDVHLSQNICLSYGYTF